jgi:putative endonuclease
MPDPIGQIAVFRLVAAGGPRHRSGILSLRAERSNLASDTFCTEIAATPAAPRNDIGNVDMLKQYCVYILTNRRHTVLYTGVTGDLQRRVYQHREKLLSGFTSRYNVSKYYECTDDASGAIAREKQIKAGPRRKKIELVDSFNPTWRDLFDDL